jgi:hypothetical protein
MAKAKAKTSADEKFTDVDFQLFEALEALDKKDYGYYDRLTEDQKKKFVPYMLLQWMSAIKGNGEIQRYYVQSTNENANMYLLDSSLKDHPKLQWLMLCSISPSFGKQFHQWIPHIKESITNLKEKATLKDITEYYKKIYPRESEETINMVSEEIQRQQKKKYYLGQLYPDMKLADIEALNDFVTEEHIKEYEKEKGN